MPRRKRFPGLCRIKDARKLDEALKKWVLFAYPFEQALEAILLAEEGYMPSEDVAPRIAGG